jgi:hypothetical protein
MIEPERKVIDALLAVRPFFKVFCQNGPTSNSSRSAHTPLADAQAWWCGGLGRRVSAVAGVGEADA